MRKIDLDVQVASSVEPLPTKEKFRRWTEAALEKPRAEISIRIVDKEESAQLNKNYRQKDGPTNVLSFPLQSAHDQETLFGDLVICAPIVVEEAAAQHRTVDAHWAHLTVHGVLHLQGYDHITEDEAQVMENLESKILFKLGFSNPYD